MGCVGDVAGGYAACGRWSMRPGPDLASLTAQGRHIAMGVRLDVSLGDRLIARDVPIAGGSVTVASEQVAESVKVDVPSQFRPRRSTDPFAPRGQRLHFSVIVEVDGRRTEIALPPCKVRSWSLPSGADRVSVTGAGLLRLVEKEPWAWPTSPIPGSSLLDEARRIVRPVPVHLERDVANVPLPRGIVWSESRLDALDDLAATYGVQWLMRADGLWGRRRVSEVHPVAHYSGALVLDDVASDDDERANEVIAWSARSETDPRRQVAIASVARAGEPISREVIELESGRSALQVREAAWAAMHRHLSNRHRRTVQIPADPRIELGDVISCAIPDGPALVGRVIGYDLPFDVTTPMRIDLEALVEA